MLYERIEFHGESRRAAQDKLNELYEGLRRQVGELKSRVSGKLEEKFTAENRRLQTLLRGLCSAEDNCDGCGAPKMLQRAKVGLLVAQSYAIVLCDTKKRSSYGESHFYLTYFL